MLKENHLTLPPPADRNRGNSEYQVMCQSCLHNAPTTTPSRVALSTSPHTSTHRVKPQKGRIEDTLGACLPTRTGGSPGHLGSELGGHVRADLFTAPGQGNPHLGRSCERTRMGLTKQRASHYSTTAYALSQWKEQE